MRTPSIKSRPMTMRLRVEALLEHTTFALDAPGDAAKQAHCMIRLQCFDTIGVYAPWKTRTAHYAESKIGLIRLQMRRHLLPANK